MSEISDECMKDASEEVDKDSDDDSSSDDDAETEEFLKKLNNLETRLKENPFQYDLHIKRLELLRETGELEKLRVAREETNSRFPLSPKLWLDWIQDEKNVASTDEEKKFVGSLFKRASKENMSVEVALEYVQHSIGTLGSIGVEGIRSAFEETIQKVGLHLAKGGLVWDAYREFESALLGGTMPDTDQHTAQRQCMLKLFLRQLSVPLMGMEDTYKEFEEWLNEEEKELDEVKEGKRKYGEELKLMNGLMPLEEAIMSTSDTLDIYKDYIEVEKSGGTRERVGCIYERTLTDHPIEANVWQGYIRFLIQGGDRQATLCLTERALRNCPWVGSLWIERLQVLELCETPAQKIKEVMEQALAAGFNDPTDYKDLWLAYLGYLKRKMNSEKLDEKEVEEFRDTSNKASEHVYQLFEDKGDPHCEILQLWAEVEATKLKDMEKARLLWNDILQMPNKNNTFMWIQYAAFEKAYGDHKHCRRVFTRGLQRTEDWPEGVAAAWMIFERTHGSLESLMTCQTKVKESLQKFAAEMKKRKEEDKKKKGAKQKSKQKEGAKVKGVAFVKAEKDLGMEKKGATAAADQSRGTKRKAEDTNAVDSDGFKVPALPTGEAKKPKVEEKAHGDQVAHDPSKDDRTVFLSNLEYETSEDEIKELFSSVGTVTELRLVKDYKGRSKGFGYLEFSSKGEAEAALKKDRSKVGNRPMFVSKCEMDKAMKGPAFRYNIGLEKNKLFVKGLSFTTTEENLKTLFSTYGEVLEVRLATYRSGKSKGFAYVDFKDETSAAIALVKTDGMELDGKVISVAISNTPNRKPKLDDRMPSLGGGPREQGTRGKGRTQISMLPRSVTSMIPRNVSKDPTQQQNGSSRPPQPSTSSKGMSNDDFRSMLLGKKS